ncbi:MAG: 50S ribosomal protein L33, partial [Candidatus Babeliales bacterium]
VAGSRSEFKRDVMAKRKRVVTHLVCEETGLRNYTLVVSKRTPGSLRLKKYCSRLRKHTWHKESK